MRAVVVGSSQRGYSLAMSTVRDKVDCKDVSLSLMTLTDNVGTGEKVSRYKHNTHQARMKNRSTVLLLCFASISKLLEIKGFAKIISQRPIPALV